MPSPRRSPSSGLRPEFEGSQRPRKTQSPVWRIRPERVQSRAWEDPSPAVWAWGRGEEGWPRLSPPEALPPRVRGVPVRATLGYSHTPPPLQPRLRPPLRLRPQLLPSRWWRRRLWPQAPHPGHSFSPSSLPLWQRPPAPPASKAHSHWPPVRWRHARA